MKEAPIRTSIANAREARIRPRNLHPLCTGLAHANRRHMMRRMVRNPTLLHMTPRIHADIDLLVVGQD